MMIDIERAYHEYVPAVSGAVFAISLPIARYLWQLCDERKPKRLLDIGSGFSSYVLRAWAEANGAEHWACDTDSEWVMHTTAFLDGHGLSPLHVCQFSSMAEWNLPQFDLVFFDCGFTTGRSWYLRKALDMVADGGVLIADDANDVHYHDVLTEHAAYYSRKSTYTDVDVERDQWGRFPGRIDVNAEPNPQPAGLRPVIYAPLPWVPEAAESLLGIAQRGFDWVQLPRARTDQSRDLAAWYLLDHPRYTHIIMLDGDQVHPPDIVHRLLRHMVNDPSKQIVAGLSFRRCKPYDPMAWIDDGHGWLETVVADTGLVQVDQVATGCVAIAREVFERIEPSWFAYTYYDAWRRVYTSDDFAFFRRVKAAGLQAWVDVETTSPHVTTALIDKAFFVHYVQDHPELIDADGTFRIDQEG